MKVNYIINKPGPKTDKLDWIEIMAEGNLRISLSLIQLLSTKSPIIAMYNLGCDRCIFLYDYIDFFVAIGYDWCLYLTI